jgi:hypothetical protein
MAVGQQDDEPVADLDVYDANDGWFVVDADEDVSLVTGLGGRPGQ